MDIHNGETEENETLQLVSAIYNKLMDLDELNKNMEETRQSIAEMNRKIEAIQQTLEEVVDNQKKQNAITQKHHTYFKVIHDVLHSEFS